MSMPGPGALAEGRELVADGVDHVAVGVELGEAVAAREAGDVPRGLVAQRAGRSSSARYSPWPTTSLPSATMSSSVRTGGSSISLARLTR